METTVTNSCTTQEKNTAEELFDLFNAEKTSLEDMLTYMIYTLKNEVKAAMMNLDPCVDVDDITLGLMKLFKSVELVQTHMELTLGILRSETKEQVLELKERFSSISNEYESIQSKDDISSTPAKTAIAIIHDKMYLKLKKLLKQCFSKGRHGEIRIVKTEDNIGRIRIVTGRFDAVHQHYRLAISVPKHDIFSFEKSSAVWQDLHQSCVFKQINTKEQIHETSKRLHFLCCMSNVVIKRCLEHKCTPSFGLILSLVKDIFYYGNQEKEAETQMLLHLMNITLDDAFMVWNLPERPLISSFLSLRHVYIGFDQQIFVPRLFPRITKELILQEYKDGTFNKIHPINQELLVAPDLQSRKAEVLEELFVRGEDTIPVRILATEPLNIKGDGVCSYSGLKYRVKKAILRNSTTDETAIVIHIHGGGFVSLSSLSHKVYLARWVKNLKLIHFSIDYRLAPANQYPDPLDDVWQAYLWILNYSETILGIKAPKIILTGDSAGGNLAMSLSLRLIRAGLQPPHGMLLIYPCLAVDGDSYSPSYFLSFDDALLPYSLLKLVAKAYTGGDFKNSEDPFISPIAASDELLEKLPPVTILAGSEDPLCDDNYRFVAKMRRLQKDIKMIVHENLSHGYLFHEELTNYNAFIQEACDEIRELVSTAN